MTELNEIIRKVRQIEIKARKISEQMLIGDFHSAFKGSGMTFSEVREYQLEDDVKHIDWNVTARTGKTHVKLFEEDRELSIILLVDLSPSMYFGSGDSTKLDTLALISAMIAFSAIQNNNKIGALFIGPSVPFLIKPMKSRKTVLQIIRNIVMHDMDSQKTDLKSGMEYMYNVIKRRAIVFVLSDFMEDRYNQALKMLSKRHEVVGIGINDLAEQQMPDHRLLRIKDIENGKTLLINTSSDLFRKWQKENLQNKINLTIQFFGEAGCDFISVYTQEDYVRKLILYFKKRSISGKRK